MAIFTAGCVELSSNTKAIREKVYGLAQQELDSSAMKMALYKVKDAINYVAFLPKERLIEENILKSVAETKGRYVVIFELDYKHVGVICENGKIIDYILDKPEAFAYERDYKTKFVDNKSGQKLHPVNLEKQRRENTFENIIFACLLFLIFGVLYGGFDYMGKMDIKLNEKSALEKQYEVTVKKEFSHTLNMIKRVDSLKILNKVEDLTQETKSTLNQIVYNNNKFCVKIQPLDKIDFMKHLPNDVKLIKGKQKDLIQYCYEKI